MERFSDKAIEIINDLHTERLDYNSEYLPLINAANKLQEIEDAEENGLLVRPLCKVGDMVYDISYQVISEDDITPFTIESIIGFGDKKLFYHIKNEQLLMSDIIDTDDFGKTVFLTREEAELSMQGDVNA